MADVELFVNGKSVGEKKGNKGIFTWDNVELAPGDNLLRATSSVFWEGTATITYLPNTLLSR